MNLTQLRSEIGAKYRLRPLPIFVTAGGSTRESVDLPWRLDEVLDDPSRLRLRCIETDDQVELHSDNVREYRSPDFLLLRCQLTIRDGVEIEPLLGNPLSETDEFIRLETQMPKLLAEMRQDLAANPLAREFVVLKRSWLYWAKGHELAYYLDDHPELPNQLHILAAKGLVEEITYSNTERYLISERLAAYLS